MKTWILAAALLGLAAPALSQRYTMPRGSFLQTPARSTAELLQEFDSNPEVSRRYMNLFGRSKEESREILSRLQPKALTETHQFPIAFYSGAGQWQYRDRVLQQGTMVFVTPEGKPFLKQECGNPVVIALPYPREKAVSSRLRIPLPKSLEPSPAWAFVGPEGSPAALLAPATSVAVTTSPEPGLDQPFTVIGDSPLDPYSSPGILAVPGVPSDRDLPFWIALLLPLAYLLHGAGDPPGVGATGHGGPPSDCCNSSPVVPEGSSWTLLAAGALGIALVGRHRLLARAS